MSIVITAAALLTGILLQGASQSSSDETRFTPFTLQVTYADGRTVPHVVGPIPGRSWTPMFPHVPGWQPLKGMLPTAAVQYMWMRIDGSRVRVSISVLLGQPHQDEQQVGSVTLGPADRVQVTELRAFGVEPVELSLAALTPVSIVRPSVLAKTTGLEVVDIEPILESSPRYRVTVRNVRDVAALSFQFEWYLGERVALSGRRGEKTGEALINPGGTYSFEMRLRPQRESPDEPWTPGSLDAFAITSILWADGEVEGDPTPAASTLVIQLGRRAQLARVVQIYREALGGDVQDANETRKQVVQRLKALSVLPGPELVTRARSLGPIADALTDAAVEGTLSAGLRDVKTTALGHVDIGSARPPFHESTLLGMLRDGRTIAERWLETVSASLPH